MKYFPKQPEMIPTEIKTYKIIITLMYTLFLAIPLNGQEYDTVYHSILDHSKLHFRLADTAQTGFRITTFNVKKLNHEIISEEENIDTFYMKRIINDDNRESYEYSFSRKKWIYTTLGSECKSAESSLVSAPTLKVEVNSRNNEIEIIDCQNNVFAIKSAFRTALYCIDTLEDKIMRKYVTKWIEECDECNFQSRLLLQDLGHLSSFIGMPATKIDSTVLFSIQAKNDTTGLLDVNYYMKKYREGDVLKFELGEDMDRSPSASEKMMNGIYGIFKENLSLEEQKRDSIRISSMKESDVATISLKNNSIEAYERKMYSSILNAEMKLSESIFTHLIEKIK